MTEDPARRRLDATVTGRVQGVGFRYFVLREALALGLDGWVANVSGGAVRCVAEGPVERLETLLDRLRQGPPSAVVTNVSEAFMPGTGTLGTFAVRSSDHGGD